MVISPSEEIKIPFVPAYDLLAEADARLSDEEAAMLGLALLQLIPGEDEAPSLWTSQARQEAISQRL